MNMKKRTSLVMAVVFTVITMAGSAFAWDRCGKNGYGKGYGPGNEFRHGKGPMFHQWTQLTDDQKSKIKTLRQEFKDKTADARTSIVSRKEQVKILMGTSAPDKAKLQTLLNEIVDLKKEVMMKGLDMALAVKAIAPELELPMGHGMGFFEMGRFGKAKIFDGERGRHWKGMQGKCANPFQKYARRANCPLLQTTNDSVPQEAETATE